MRGTCSLSALHATPTVGDANDARGDVVRQTREWWGGHDMSDNNRAAEFG